MKIQLWSYNYAPEPTGIAPVSTAWALALRDRGHEIDVVAAHPHYPDPRWGAKRLPYRETVDGIAVTRLPLWIGRATAKQRMRQEASFAAALTIALPALPRADVTVAVSPSFPALAAAILNKRLRGTPWVLWLQDILPDGAVSTGIVEDGAMVRSARKLEHAAYRSADRIAVISSRFEENLLAKGVAAEKLTLVYNPATRAILQQPRHWPAAQTPRILVIGNIGHSQGLASIIRDFESSRELADRGARLVITGAGVAEAEVRAAITTNRVAMLGLVSDEQLAKELDAASIGLVTQRSDFPEFNLPSKLMNYFARGLPVVGAVGRDSEVARLIRETDAGWIADNNDRSSLGRTISAALDDGGELRARGENGRRFAVDRLSPDALAAQFEELLEPIARLRS
jgi:colanic acid biosynthesis glycosyl transferase WcaI